jgi:ketosteroid isomerase-like protein
LGYAYGTCLGEGSDTSKYGFLRVWRLQADGAWKILADVTP